MLHTDLNRTHGSRGTHASYSHRRTTHQDPAYRGPGRRRRTIADPLGFRFFRVFPPLASLPVGEHGCRPPDVRPSPPPIGWLTGFWATPRWCGFLPIHRLRPAFPRLMFMWSGLDIPPMLARQAIGTRRISPL